MTAPLILETLVHQFNQRFQQEKRARVCLWFDERQEFARLLDALERHLESMPEPPFRLLRYDPDLKQGQIWIRFRIHEAVAAAGPGAAPRFVVYLPLGEERFDQPGPKGEPTLDLLSEYRIAGVTWRINGKRPTLFGLMRLAGAGLPEAVAEQRRLYDGGRDSLLAKYASRFVDRPAGFWTGETLTPGLAQSRLLDDADKVLLDLACDPETVWQGLEQKGLRQEFLASVRDRYGFEQSPEPLDDWLREFVAVTALTEAFLGYHEPADFPFQARLPPLPCRPNHRALLQRWLRDTDGRAAWDHWVTEAEAKYDLSAWAKGRPGLSVGFPHLVRLRWEEVRQAFEQAADKHSAITEFFQQHGELIGKEVEFGKNSSAALGAWTLLRDLGLFIAACRDAASLIDADESPGGLARLYVDWAGKIERRHLLIRWRAEEQNFPAAMQVADRVYGDYANPLNLRFFQGLAAQCSAEIPGCPPVTTRLEAKIWKAKGRRAVVIVDALRYDCALAIQESLTGYDVRVEPVTAVLPTITPIGMTALLPLSQASLTLETKNNGLSPRLDGKDAAVRANRLAFLTQNGADCRDIADVEGLSEASDGFGDLLVISGHDEVDHIGHGEAQTLIRHLQIEIDRLTRLVKKLHRWGYEKVHIVTDHGFVLVDPEKLPAEVNCDKNWCHVRKERFAVVPAEADLPLATFPFPWDTSVRIAVPPGLAFFSAEKSFSHGGASVQELVIPHLTSSRQMATEKRIGVEIVMPTTELLRTSVKVVLRPVASAPSKGQLALFSETGRTLLLEVRRLHPGNCEVKASVLATSAKEVRLEPGDPEQSVTLFFNTAASFTKGELLELDIRDAETAEQFPPGGIKLTAGRDM